MLILTEDMRKVITDEASVRKLIREALFGNFNPPPDESVTAANVSNVIDPSASATDPTNPNFRPQSRQELIIAVNGLLNCVEDDYAGVAYEKVKDALEGEKDIMTPPDQEHGVINVEDENMTKENVEETIRLQVRKALREMSQDDVDEAKKMKFAPGYNEPVPEDAKGKAKLYLKRAGGNFERAHDEAAAHGERDVAEELRMMSFENVDEVDTSSRTYVLKKKKHNDVNEQDQDQDDDDDDEESHKKRKNQTAASWSGGTFDEIAKELGVSVSGAKRLVTVALAKAQYVGSIDPDELEILTLETMKEYIEYLKSSGELTAADVQLLQDHPALTAELDGFREFLHDAIKEHEATTRPEDSEKNRLNPYDKEG